MRGVRRRIRGREAAGPAAGLPAAARLAAGLLVAGTLAAGLPAVPGRCAAPPPAPPPAAAAVTAPEAVAAPEPSGVDALYARWRPLLQREAAGPGAAAEDVYKLLFQGLLGPAHAGIDSAGALAWLREEWAQARREAAALAPAATPAATPAAAPAAASATALLEPVRPDSLLVRVHLGPLVETALRGVPADAESSVTTAALAQLAGAFARTAAVWRGAPDLLPALWARAAADTALWGGAGGAARAAELGAAMAAAGWPARHHSEEYAARRAPHYRVVARDLVPPSWREGGGP